MFTHIRAAGVTVQGVLQSRFPANPDRAPTFDQSLGGKAIISLAMPDGMETASDIALSTWLYRLIRDEQTLKRRLGSEVLSDGW